MELDKANVVRFENRRWVRDKRTLGGIFGVATIGALIAAMANSLNFADQLAEVAMISALLYLLLRFSKIPAAQPFVQFDEFGISYGHKQFVPWKAVAQVERVRRRGLRRHLYIRTELWKAEGVFGFAISRSPLPLSGLDPSRDDAQWLEPFRKFAPTVALPPN